MFPVWCVWLRTQVSNGDAVCECAKCVSQSFRDVQTSAGYVVKLDSIPLSEGGGTNSNVDHDVQNPTREALHVLRLARRDICEVNASNSSAL